MLLGHVIIPLLSLLLCGCLAVPSNTTSQLTPPPSENNAYEPVILAPGDVIDVKFLYWPELDYRQIIRPDGKISLQLIDEVVAAGRSPQGLDDHLTQLYANKLKSPEITVFVVSLTNQNIYVGGEVEAPGVLPVAGRLSALQAVFNAGGFKETANPEHAIVIRRGEDNRPVSYAVNLQRALHEDGADLMLRPDDIVYIPKSSIAKVNQFVRQYIQDLLLYRGVGFGLSYDLNPSENN